MAGTLRKVPGFPPEMGLYQISGTLEGVTPGRRAVRTLEVRRITESSVDGLSPLTAFKDLRTLEVEPLSGVDLTPLRELTLERLSLKYLQDVNLAPLAALELDDLELMHLRDDCHVPDSLALRSSLRALAIVNDGPDLPGAPVKALLEAVDWPRLGALRSLVLLVGGEARPIEVDLGFLRHLSELQYLDVLGGIRHSSAEPSPLEPPFDGLSRGLKRLRIDAWEPEILEQQLRRYLGANVAFVDKRYAFEPGGTTWSVAPPSDTVEEWSAYGSLYDATDGCDGAIELHTEYEALQVARRRIREVDAALLRRLDFDEESDGTGIMARSREDLERALRILGIQ